MSLKKISATLVRQVSTLEFAPPVTHVYNPLVYAKKSHTLYLERFGVGPKEAIFLGMNPGPFGMAQTGVPFGEIALVRDWMGISAPVEKPNPEHPKRPVQGFDCTRREVSGARLWGWARDRFESPERFFKRFFVWNYCPLAFLQESGRNHTPDKLPAAEREPLFQACDRALQRIVAELQPERVIGVGVFAENRAKAALSDTVPINRILHPSPASPAANKNWAKAAEAALTQMGVKL